MKIILATDGSAYSQAVVEVLKRFPLPAPTDLTVLSVLADDEIFHTAEIDMEEADRNGLDALYQSQRQQAERLLAREAERFAATGWTVHTMLREGHVAHQIVTAAEELAADLVAVGARGVGGIKRFLLGSVSHRVIRYAPCSVLVARTPAAEAPAAEAPAAPRPSEPDSPFRILVAYDGSNAARTAVAKLAALPLGDRVEVTITTVMTLVTSYRMDIVQRFSAVWQERKRAARADLAHAAQVVRHATPHVRTELHESGNAADAILQAAQKHEADLIVVGHKGKSGIARFLLGSVANEVAQYASCSVLLVRD
jgi:nucleotide-binding universal stress UspA family protein